MRQKENTWSRNQYQNQSPFAVSHSDNFTLFMFPCPEYFAHDYFWKPAITGFLD